MSDNNAFINNNDNINKKPTNFKENNLPKKTYTHTHIHTNIDDECRGERERESKK